MLSFPIDGVPTGESTADGPAQPLLLGDVVICPEVAAANAPGHAGTLEDELALLVVHGVLHVLGHDHGTPDEARRHARPGGGPAGAPARAGRRRHRDPDRGGPVILAATDSTLDVVIVISIIVLLVIQAFLALAETALTRMGRNRAHGHLEAGHRGSKRLMELVEDPARFLNSLLLVILICQTVQTALTTLIAERLFGAAGVIVALVLNVALVFVLSEAAPKTWAVQHPDAAALRGGGPGLGAHAASGRFGSSPGP